MRPSLCSIALSGLLLLPSVALADTFNFSAGGSGGGFLGSGVLIANPTGNGDGSFLITGISGTGVTDLSTFNGADNLLFPNAASLLDGIGLSFTDTLAGGTLDVNLYSTAATSTGYAVTTRDPDGDYNTTSANFSLAGTSAVPEPSSLLLLGTGVLATAGALRRRLTR